MIAPCRDCDKGLLKGYERHYKCHASCDKYLAFRKQRQTVNDKRRRETILNYEIAKCNERKFKNNGR